MDDGNQQFTYQELLNRARHFGLSFLNRTEPGRPVAILHEKSSEVLSAMFGVVYAGCFYVMIDPEQPLERLKDILTVLETDLVITDSTYRHQLDDAGYQGQIYLLEEEPSDEAVTAQELDKLMERRSFAKNTDLLMVFLHQVLPENRNVWQSAIKQSLIYWSFYETVSDYGQGPHWQSGSV